MGFGINIHSRRYRFFNDGGWPALFFGALMFATGFFKPKRCISDEHCEL
jgi:hypothetical protein